MLRIHASFHKCLTMYYLNVMKGVYNRFRIKERYRHFESLEGMFYNMQKNYRVISTNNFAIDLNRLEDDFRITRFIRDPRDLIVSGYFYHKRGAEPWFRQKNPTLKYWSPINANVPTNMPNGISYAEYLQQLPKEEGLLAEIEWRQFHLESLRQWFEDDRIKIFRYENIINNSEAVFDAIFRFYELSILERKFGVFLAGRYSLKRSASKSKHIRNPKPGQWREHFTPKVEIYFNNQYGDILDLLSYR